MRKWLDALVAAPIAHERVEEDTIYYSDAAGELLAQAYYDEGNFYSATFYGEGLHTSLTCEQAEQIALRVQQLLGLEELQLHSVTHDEEGYLAEFRRFEPMFGLLIQGCGLFVTITENGFVAHVSWQHIDVEIDYPKQMITKEEARALVQQQSIVQLGIARELGWQYAYVPNHDLFGVSPEGHIRLWSNEPEMQDARYEPLPAVEPIAHFETFLKGGRNATIEAFVCDAEQRWVVECEEEEPVLQEDSFYRACQIVQHLVGEAYVHYYSEHFPTLRKLLKMDEHTVVTYRFVFRRDDISLDFEALAVSLYTATNQIVSVHYPLIPYNKLRVLPPPTISLQEANAIVAQLIDVEMILESDLINAKKRKLVYTIHYPSSPTGSNIQMIDAYTGNIHWLDNGLK